MDAAMPWRPFDHYGETNQDTPTGSLRNRRRDRPSISINELGEDMGTSSRSSPHPLLPAAGMVYGTPNRGEEAILGARSSITNFDEISRPSLFRLTSDLEREVHAANVISRSSVDDTSLRGSFDGRRNNSVKQPPKEVEVIVHEIKPRESLQGIALRYGIDLATLRKVNKLWPTDPLHLRRQLYVPLEECKWAKASDLFVRGPGEGEITIHKKGSKNQKGSPSRTVISSDIDTPAPPTQDDPFNFGLTYTDKGKGREVDYATPQNPPDLASVPLPKTGAIQPSSDGQVLSIIRIPASELSFFPKNKANSNNASRRSLDTGLLDAFKRPSSPGPSPRNSFSAASKAASSPSSLRNSFESLTRPFSGRVNSMTPIEESGNVLNSKVDPSQSGIELLPTKNSSNGQTTSRRKPERKTSSGWNLNFFSVADDGMDPQDVGRKIKI